MNIDELKTKLQLTYDNNQNLIKKLEESFRQLVNGNQYKNNNLILLAVDLRLLTINQDMVSGILNDLTTQEEIENVTIDSFGSDTKGF